MEGPYTPLSPQPHTLSGLELGCHLHKFYEGMIGSHVMTIASAEIAGKAALDDDLEECGEAADDMTSAFATQLQRVLDVDVQHTLRTSREAAETPVSALRTGANVRLIGLASRPELNGQTGVVTQQCAQAKDAAAVSPSQQRWGVLLTSGQVVSVKKINMVTPPARALCGFHFSRETCALNVTHRQFFLETAHANAETTFPHVAHGAASALEILDRALERIMDHRLSSRALKDLIRSACVKRANLRIIAMIDPKNLRARSSGGEAASKQLDPRLLQCDASLVLFFSRRPPPDYLFILGASVYFRNTHAESASLLSTALHCAPQRRWL